MGRRFARAICSAQSFLSSDERSGLRALIAVHSTARGPALGGTRFHAYRSDADALRDVLNLARGMSYKAAMAGLDRELRLRRTP